VVGRFGMLKGKVVGFTTRIGNVFKRFRLDYDPAKGPHINVEIGSGSQGRRIVFPFTGTEEEVVRLAEGNFGP
jgi:hypothetical protein